MKQKIYTLVALILLSSTVLTAQTVDKCAADDIERAAILKDPSILLKIDDLEFKTREFIQSKKLAKSTSSATYTIPVVIHIIHNGEPIGTGTNISDIQALSQITRLNEDFRKMNADTLNSTHPYYAIQADCEIEFCLAVRDPDGNPTTGILRYNKMQPSWTIAQIDSTVKPSTIWNRNNYMNIWSINIQDPNSPGVDGFGTFPSSTSDTTDGVVIANWVFGTVGGVKSIVGTHEVGHYLNLKHVWGDNQPNCGDDLVADTPPSSEPNSGCPTFPHNPNDSCGTGPNGDIFMNYMDYSDAECTVMFTTGQKDRMQATLSTVRSSFLTSNGCSPTVGISENVSKNIVEIYPNPSNGIFTINTSLNLLENINLIVYDVFASKVLQVKNIKSIPYNLDLSNLANGVYYLKINIGSESLTQKIIVYK